MKNERGKAMQQHSEGTLQRRAAFTLIELLIVVAIIAILAAIAVPNFLEAQVRAKVSRAQSDMRAIATALEAYRTDHNGYPPDFNGSYPLYGNPASGEPEGDWKTYRCMTTPIAYITSAPLDAFPIPGTNNVLPRLRFYPYVDQPVVISWNYPSTGSWIATGTMWLLVTTGPDLVGSVPWLGYDLTPGAVSNACYDATNGTKSGGDIGRSNVRSYP